MTQATNFDATIGALTLKQCANTTLSPNIQVGTARGTANVHADAHFVESGRPVASFTTTDIAGVFASVDPSAGLAVASGTVTLPYRVRADGGSFASGTSHFSVSSANGLLVPTSLSVQGTGTVSMGLDFVFSSTDGATSPIASNTSVTLASDASFNAEYRLYPPSINASTVSGVTGVTVNFGVTVTDNLEEDGFVYPTEIYIPEVNPTIDWTFRSQAVADAYLPFLAQTAGIVKLRKKAASGTLVATATAQHVTLTSAAGVITLEQIASQGTDPTEVTIRQYVESLTVSVTDTL